MEIVKSTTSSISTIIGGVNSITSMIGEVSENMNDQIGINSEVNSKAQEAQRLSDEIERATGEQKVATGEIVRSITSINELTQANASGSEELSVGAENVSNLADGLKKAIDFFKI
jgi:methyl-accepting chemotaxis protein